jgi:hypothetical protein
MHLVPIYKRGKAISYFNTILKIPKSNPDCSVDFRLSLALHLLVALDPFSFYRDLIAKRVWNNTYKHQWWQVYTYVQKELQTISHINSRHYLGKFGIVFCTNYNSLSCPTSLVPTTRSISQCTIAFHRYSLPYQQPPWLITSSNMMVSVPHCTVAFRTGCLVWTVLLHNNQQYHCLFHTCTTGYQTTEYDLVSQQPYCISLMGRKHLTDFTFRDHTVLYSHTHSDFTSNI